MGTVHLGRDCQRLHDLRLAATGDHPVCRQPGDEHGLSVERVVDDAGLHCGHVRRLVAVEAGVLKMRGYAYPVDSRHVWREVGRWTS